MPDETLQVAFEIKTACDEISRKLLRWHWERKPGAHSLNALLEHIAQRQQESPEYYERMPDLSGRTSWSQLDTTLCMRVLLDPEKDAAHPLDLLGNTEHPGAARRACNAVRTARNEAALRTSELEQYYRQAEAFLDRCGARKPVARASQPEGQETRSTGKVRNASQRNGSGSGTAANRRPRSGSAGRTSGSRNGTARKNTTNRKQGGGRRSRTPRTNYAVLGLLLAMLVLGLLFRWMGMGK